MKNKKGQSFKIEQIEERHSNVNIELFSGEELTSLEALRIRGGNEKIKQDQYACGSNLYQCQTGQTGNCVSGCACSS
ncbi:hypothetical protein [Prolixibacter sp. SD074]|jgi:hypothetical protein|uniref:hypothetical protein n=1 Tax=Prolixibacter sp. SD074 TaxID=2652391 RepID=UPI001284AFBF|nr:hypothetical protein [Prolixibacter sp. SD074]GET30779.1 hypothetical protein SD074_29810 [Prolixibacter sp. SD074]